MSPRVLDMTEGEGLRRCVLLRNAFRLSQSLEASRSTLSVADLVQADSGYSELSDASASSSAMGISVCDYDFGDEAVEGGDATGAPMTTTIKSEAQWFDELLFEMGSAQLGEAEQDHGDAESDSDDELSDSDEGDEGEADFSPFSRPPGARSHRHPLARVWTRRARSRPSARKGTASSALERSDNSIDELAGLELDLASLGTLSSAVPVRKSLASTPASLASLSSSFDECPALVRDDGEDDSCDSDIDSDEGHSVVVVDAAAAAQALRVRPLDALNRAHGLQHQTHATDDELYQPRLASSSSKSLSSQRYGPPRISTDRKPSTSHLKVSSEADAAAAKGLDLLRSVSSIRALSESAWRNAVSLDDLEAQVEAEDAEALWSPPRAGIRAW